MGLNYVYVGGIGGNLRLCVCVSLAYYRNVFGVAENCNSLFGNLGYLNRF